MATLHEWFAATAARHPDRIGLEVAGETFTYREMDDLSARLAAQVQDEAGGVPARVGLLAHRSAVAYLGYLAIQRMGSTAVPLDPGSPARHNAAVAMSADVDFVISDGDDSPLVEGTPTRRPDLGQLSNAGSRFPPSDSEPRPIAYLLFTSGSTGTPKGVPISHTNVSAYLQHVIRRYRLGPGDRVSHNFALTFDLSVFDLYGSWGSGATLVVPEARDLISSVGYVNRARITHWLSVPSMILLAARRGALRPGAMPDLRWSLFCGEPLIESQAGAWMAAAPDSVLENLYGPTEATVSCLQYRLPAGRTVRGSGVMPIGTANPGVETLVLDESGMPADTGELCLRGAQRFDGYLDPDNNAGRFVTYDGTHPATPYDGATPLTDQHWYRTGDRVVHSPEGLSFVGRIDNQVKVNGYRVELGDIEAHLRRIDGVDEAVATVTADQHGDPRLQAAVVGSDLDPTALLADLRLALPGYMIPCRVSVLTELPRNPNGKVDRAATAEAIDNDLHESPSVSPCTPGSGSGQRRGST